MAPRGCILAVAGGLEVRPQEELSSSGMGAHEMLGKVMGR